MSGQDDRPPAQAHSPAYAPADLTSCEAEPIHRPGAIQPYGVLLVVEAAEPHVVVAASENTERLLGVDHDRLLGEPLTRGLGEELSTEVATRVREQTMLEPLIRFLDLPSGKGEFQGAEIDVTLNRSGERLLVELEPVGRPRSVMLTYQSARGAMARISAAQTVDDLAAQLAWEVRDLLDYDRVMVYRFDAEWNGEVIAEERRADLNSFMGLHYPASDIPAQARRLYTVNWTRLIADVDYVPVTVTPLLDPGTGEPFDLSASRLRSVSPIHLEYLANMGVGASMSISIVHEGRLWGLVACHHYSGAHRPSQDARNAAEFLAQVASQQIHEREQRDLAAARLAATEALARITGRAGASILDPVANLVDDPDLLRLLSATGAAALQHGVYLSAGSAPPEHVTRVLVPRLLAGGDAPVVSTDHAVALAGRGLPLDEHTQSAAGVLALRMGEGGWIAWFRSELPKVVSWGGDPHNKEIASREGDQVRLSPRKSFEAWTEIVRGRSLPWEPWQEAIAHELGVAITGLMLTRVRDQIVVAESLQRTVLEGREPQVPGWGVAVRYEPATSYALGGDWWDSVTMPDGRVALAVGDMAGHGVEAVAAMTQVSACLRAYLHSGSGAGEALQQVDRLMCDSWAGQVASAVVVVVDPATGRCEVATAGHPAPFVAGPDRDAEVVAVRTAPVLGFGSGTAKVDEIVLEPGECLVMITDGLIERRGVDPLQTLERFRAAIGRGPGGSDPEAWLASLFDAVPGETDDDRTTLFVCRPVDA